MLVIGLTGGIGSGKSTVLRVFQRLGAYIIDADRLSRETVKPGSPASRDIRRRFGGAVFFKNGQLNRKKLAQLVFNDEKALSYLNAIVHPRVFEAEKRMISKIAKKDKGAIVVVDAPLMIESGSHEWKDLIVVVNASEEDRLHRLCKKRKFTRNEAIKRIHSQMPNSEKLKYADFVIHNVGTLGEIRKIAADTFQKILDSRGKRRR